MSETTCEGTLRGEPGKMNSGRADGSPALLVKSMRIDIRIFGRLVGFCPMCRYFNARVAPTDSGVCRMRRPARAYRRDDGRAVPLRETLPVAASRLIAQEVRSMPVVPTVCIADAGVPCYAVGAVPSAAKWEQRSAPSRGQATSTKVDANGAHGDCARRCEALRSDQTVDLPNLAEKRPIITATLPPCG